MTKAKLKTDIEQTLKKHLRKKHASAFLFGSFVRGAHFHDLDVGIMGADTETLTALRDDFEESTLPYHVDVVDFSKVTPAFKKKVFDDGILWLTKRKS